MSTMTIELLQEMIDKLKAIPKNDQWILINPEGEIYKGTVQQMSIVLLQRHPLFQMPTFSGYRYQDYE